MQLEQLKSSYKVLYHASIYINEGIYIDPYNIDENKHDAKYVLITHPHFDHLSIEDIKKVINDKTIIIATFDSIEKLKENKIDNEVIKVSVNNIYNIDNMRIETIPAYNKEKSFHPSINGWVGYKIEVNNCSYYIIGDSDYNEYMNSIDCDVLFVPIGGTYTMNYLEASKLTNKIKPKIVVPIHFNSIKGLEVDLNDFVMLIDKNIKINED